MTTFVLRHKALTVLLWVVLSLLGALSARTLMNGVDYTYTTPGQPGYVANQHILQRFRLDATFEPFLAVLHLPPGQGMDTAAGRQLAAHTFAAASGAGITAVADYASTGNPVFLLRHGQATWALINLPNPDKGPGAGIEARVDPAMQRAVPTGAKLTLTGFAQLLSGGASDPRTLAAGLLLGLLAAGLVLLLVFRTALAVVPVLLALPVMLITALSVSLLARLTPVSYFVPYLILLLSPGLAVDYALIVVTRWREERERGLDPKDAVRAAMSRAGRTVLLSGLTISAGLLSLLALPVPFLQSIGVGGLLIPLVATAAALTLLPILLSVWGARLDARRLWFSSGPRPSSSSVSGQTSATYSPLWAAWARLILRHRWLALLSSLALLGVLTWPAFSLNTAEPLIGSLSGSGPAATAFQELRAGGIPAAVDFPIQVITHGGDVGARQATAIALDTPGVYTVFAPDTPPFRQGQDALLTIIPRIEGGTPQGRALVAELTRRLAGVPGGAEVGGSSAGDLAFSAAVYGHFPQLLLVIAVLSLLILTTALRSVVLALKAVVLNLVSLGAAFGFMVLFWQQGHGSLLYGVSATGAIRDWIPVVVFACLYGLSMDYEVFVMARMREEYDRLSSTDPSSTDDATNQATDHAIVAALARTGRLVTSAAVILMCSFLALTADPNQIVRVVGSTLAAGVLVDAVIIRTLLVPALVSLLGRWNWWTPRWGRWSGRRTSKDGNVF